MPEIRPFTGLLYDPAIAGPLEAVTTPPYDVIAPADQDRYYGASPFNVVRLILGKDESDDDESTNQYTRAASCLREWEARGVLVRTSKPSLFPYEFTFQLEGRRRRVRGIIAEVELEPWGGSILPHERTLPGPIDDRLKLLRTVRANLSPIYAVLAGTAANSGLLEFLETAMKARPDREMADEAGTRHRLWITSNGSAEMAEAIRRDRLMIGDGHHRYAVALTYRKQMRARFGPGPWDAVMMLIVDAKTEDPPVLPIHRVVLLAGPVPEATGERVRDLAEVLASLREDELTYGTVRVEQGELVHRVARLQGAPPIVCALHERVLDRLDSLDLRFVHDPVVAEASVRTGEALMAYLLPPTKVERVWSVIASGEMLPQKSTYFWPKPRTGMVIRPLGPTLGIDEP